MGLQGRRSLINFSLAFRAKCDLVLKDLSQPSTDVLLSKKKAGRPLLAGNVKQISQVDQ